MSNERFVRPPAVWKNDEELYLKILTGRERLSQQHISPLSTDLHLTRWLLSGLAMSMSKLASFIDNSMNELWCQRS
jgi:hypothetical protein